MKPRNLICEEKTWTSPHQVAVHLLEPRVAYQCLLFIYLYLIFSEGIAMGSHKLHDSFKVALPRTNGMT